MSIILGIGFVFLIRFLTDVWFDKLMYDLFSNEKRYSIELVEEFLSRNFFGRLISCRMCFSFWFSLVMSILYFIALNDLDSALMVFFYSPFFANLQWTKNKNT